MPLTPDSHESVEWRELLLVVQGSFPFSFLCSPTPPPLPTDTDSGKRAVPWGPLTPSPLSYSVSTSLTSDILPCPSLASLPRAQRGWVVGSGRTCSASSHHHHPPPEGRGLSPTPLRSSWGGARLSPAPDTLGPDYRLSTARGAAGSAVRVRVGPACGPAEGRQTPYRRLLPLPPVTPLSRLGPSLSPSFTLSLSPLARLPSVLSSLPVPCSLATPHDPP